MKKQASKKITKKKSVELTPEQADIKKLGARIRSLRIKAGFTNHEDFAYENEIGRTQYNKWEQGQDIQFSSLMKLIRAFGITPIEFFSEGF